MTDSLARAWRDFGGSNTTGLPRLCGGCRQWYSPEDHTRPGGADLEGIVFAIGGRELAGDQLNICPACGVKALAGRKPFRRRGTRVEVTG